MSGCPDWGCPSQEPAPALGTEPWGTLRELVTSTGRAVGPAAPTQDGQSLLQAAEHPCSPSEPCFGGRVLMAASPCAGTVPGPTARWGTLLGPGAPSPSALMVFKTLKLIYLRAFVDAPSGVLRPFHSSWTRTRMGIEVPMSPWFFHHPVHSRGTEGPQRTPQQHNPLTGASWGSRASPPSQPGKAAGPVGSRGAPSSYTAQPRCNFGNC